MASTDLTDQATDIVFGLYLDIELAALPLIVTSGAQEPAPGPGIWSLTAGH
jgi:hypothetical protein